MRKFEKNVVSTSYCVELAVEEMLNLIESYNANDEDLLTDSLNLIVGVSDVDYNGHFGPVIYLTLEAEYDTLRIWEEIFDCINDHITQEENDDEK